MLQTIVKVDKLVKFNMVVRDGAKLGNIRDLFVQNDDKLRKHLAY